MAEIPAATGERRTGRLLASLIVVMIVFGGVGMTLLARRYWWLLPVASAHGVDVDRLIYTTFVVTGIVFVLVHILIAALVWRSGARGTERAAYWHDDRTLELTYTLVPAAVLVTRISVAAVAWARGQAPAPAASMAGGVRRAELRRR